MKLVKDARVWLEGNETVSLVKLVRFKLEDPCYRCPMQNLTESEFAELEFPPMNEIMHQPFMLSGLLAKRKSGYGPAVHKGFVWVGNFSGFFEFWALGEYLRHEYWLQP